MDNSLASPESTQLKISPEDESNPNTSENDDTTLSTHLKRQRLYSQLIATLIVSWESIIAGYASAYTSPADISMKKDLSLTLDEISWISGLLPVGALIGSLSGGVMIEYLGRKYTLLMTNAIFLMAWSINFFAQNYWHMYISRMLSGCSVGISSFAIPVYLAETVQPKIRGRLSLLSSSFGNFGILLCFILGNILEWRGLAGFGVLLSIPFYTFIWIIPETPRWYLSKKKIEKSRASLQWLRGKNCNVDKEFDELLRLRNASHKDAGIRLIFTQHYFRSFLIVLGLMFFQQFSGINAVIFYTAQIFEESGSSLDAFLCTAIVGVVNFLSTFIASTLIDKLGRKVLLYISGVIMANTLMILGIYFFLLKVQRIDLTLFGWVPLTNFVLYVLGFSLGFGPVPWLMMGEILPAAIRGHAASICTAFNWTCTFIVIKSFPMLIEIVGSHGTYSIFACLMVLSLIFTKFFVPETKRKTLEEIERLLSGE